MLILVSGDRKLTNNYVDLRCRFYLQSVTFLPAPPLRVLLKITAFAIRKLRFNQIAHKCKCKNHPPVHDTNGTGPILFTPLHTYVDESE